MLCGTTGHDEGITARAAGAFKELMPRSSCDLRSLFLSVARRTKYQTSAADIQSFLDAASIVVHLELARATTNAMSAIKTADILPRLKTLKIHDFCQNSPNRQW